MRRIYGAGSKTKGEGAFCQISLKTETENQYVGEWRLNAAGGDVVGQLVAQNEEYDNARSHNNLNAEVEAETEIAKLLSPPGPNINESLLWSETSQALGQVYD